MMLESKIQSKILKYLRTVTGCWAVKVMECNQNGCPDILVCYKGRFIAFEVKAPTGRLSDIQAAQLSLISQADGDWYVVRSLDQVKEIINDK